MRLAWCWPGMPELMASVVHRLDDESQALALMNWLLIGEAGRQRWRRFINAGRSKRRRRARSTEAVARLLAH
jgi:hypothetical protein